MGSYGTVTATRNQAPCLQRLIMFAGGVGFRMTKARRRLGAATVAWRERTVRRFAEWADQLSWRATSWGAVRPAWWSRSWKPVGHYGRPLGPSLRWCSW